MSITNAHRITMVCYDPEGFSTEAEELFIEAVPSGNGISRYILNNFGNPDRKVVCEHVASTDDGPVSPEVAERIFAP